MLKKTLLYLFVCLSFVAISQTKKRHFKQREIGIFGGGSYYIGDLNPRTHFKFSHPAVGILFRYSTNYRFAFRFGLNYGTISADDSKSKEADQLERNLNFRSRIYDFHSVAEFNFVEYRIGHEKHYMSLYLFAGLGAFYMNPQSNIGNGYQDLQSLKNEGQSKSYSKIQISLPFGVGFKWNLTNNIGLAVEWGPRKTFTDYLDDVSGAYPKAGIGSVFSNQSKNGAAFAGSMRGNPRTKDWFFYYGFTINFKLPSPDKECHGMSFGG